MEKYNHKEIESKWQKFWAENKNNFCDLDDETKTKFYNLVMFFYPSGAKIHIGHGYNYTGSDVFGRYKRLNGFNVFQPMGYDAFGLPAENYAIKTGQHPSLTTQANIDFGRRQLQELGLMYDWEKEVNTSSPEYYKWTQWLFGVLYKAGLAYRKEAPVNWCPSCKTVLANEQVTSGKCERCETEVIQKNLKQWFFKITDYADKLLEGHKKINWPEKTILMQKNWIGKSEGAEVTFKVPIKNINCLVRLGFKTQPNSNEIGADSFKTQPNSNEIGADRTIWFVTFTTKKRENVLQTSEQILTIINALFNSCLRHDFNLHEIAVMEEHVHVVLDTDKHITIDKIYKYLKGYSSKKFQDRFNICWPNSKGDHLWTPKGDYSILENREQYEKILKYTQGNPETKNLCRRDRLLSENLDKLYYELKVFTTRPDTLFGTTFMVVAPEHKLVKLGFKTQFNQEVKKYIEQSKNKSDLERTDLAKEKTGVELKGIKAINPVNSQEIPIFVADYVLPHYGTGAIMAVPGHDERDFEFAKKYELPIIEVVKHANNDANKCEYHANDSEKIFVDDGVAINSDFINGLETKDAKEKIISWLEEKGLGKREVNYRLRDWLISRQRYWGAPIPLVFCENCAGKSKIQKPVLNLIQDPKSKNNEFNQGELLNPGWILVPEEDLPVKLPELENFKPTDDGESPLARSKEFVNTKCPKCGQPAKRSTETMDTFVCSSWYFLRYLSPHLKDFAFDKELAKKWLPVDQYCGGAEHACMHLLYARFITKVLFDQGLINFDEPFLKLNHQGMILAADGGKMSKSKGNVVIPDDYVKKYGADVFRLYVLFLAPFEQGGVWNDQGIVGVKRFLEKVWNIQFKFQDTISNPESSSGQVFQINSKSQIPNSNLDILLNQTIKKVGEDIENFHFNTAISALMILVNEMEKFVKLGFKTQPNEYQLLITLLSPFAPHLAEELWQNLGHKESIQKEKWPAYDPKLILADEFELVIQVNGKVRDKIIVPTDILENEATKIALSSEKIKHWLNNQEPKKIIYVKNKLINLVI